MFVTNWISTTKIQKISEITNFFRHYFLSRTEVVVTNIQKESEEVKSEKRRVKNGEWRVKNGEDRGYKSKNLRESLPEGFSGAYETRTRDLLRDRQAF